jgi:hypothetical protein
MTEKTNSARRAGMYLRLSYERGLGSERSARSRVRIAYSLLTEQESHHD